MSVPIGSLRPPLLHVPRTSRVAAVNVNQSHVANARVVGMFLHTTCSPSAAPYGLALGQVSKR
ncbi:hypothetical protein [Selenomonas noxia]|uniref:hypothetical protein n=1 Tax=Selenomonas noxia TaxID=135083 RepID=UPI0028892F02|nr:hypothetical protein [Selenomonas noxia]